MGRFNPCKNVSYLLNQEFSGINFPKNWTKSFFRIIYKIGGGQPNSWFSRDGGGQAKIRNRKGQYMAEKDIKIRACDSILDLIDIN